MVLTKNLIKAHKERSVVELYQAGIGVEKLAQVMGWTKNNITRTLKRASIEVGRYSADLRQKV